MYLEFLYLLLQLLDLLLLLLTLERHFVSLDEPLALLLQRVLSCFLQNIVLLLDHLFLLGVLILLNAQHVLQDADVFHVGGQLLLRLRYLLKQEEFHV